LTAAVLKNCFVICKYTALNCCCTRRIPSLLVVGVAAKTVEARAQCNASSANDQCIRTRHCGI